MKLEERTTLSGYIRHAEHFGTEEVFETALDEGLTMKDLGFLALRLQNLDPKWKLTLENQERFFAALMNVGVPMPKAAGSAGISIATARLWQQEDVPEESPDLALRRASKERFEHLRPIVRGTSKRR